MFMTSHEIFGQKWEYFSKMIFLAVMSKYMCHVQLLCIPTAISREKT